MKRLSTLLISCFLLLNAVLNVNAASPTPETNQKILEDLRDRVASTVAKLNLVERRGITGTVTDISNTQITLSDVKGNTRFVDVDELTKFSSLENSASFGISDIKKDSMLGVLGLYNKQSRRILARSISEVAFSKMINGSIATIDSDNFVFHIATEKKEQYSVSVETTTRTFSYDLESQEMVRSGFSRLKENDKVFVKGAEVKPSSLASEADKRGQEDKEDEKRISADKIIVFPDTTPVSTGSGKKLTPITE